MEELYAKLTKGVRKTKHKTVLFLCGSAGTGKTSSVQHVLRDAKLSTTFVYLNVDQLRDHITKYKQLQDLAYQIMKDGYNLVWDKTCRNVGDGLSELEQFKKHGYRTIVSMLYAELDTVVDRVAKRVNQPVPEDIVREIYQNLEDAAPRYLNKSFIDEVFLYNNEHTLKLMFHRQKKQIQCHSPDTKFYFDVSEYC